MYSWGQKSTNSINVCWCVLYLVGVRSYCRCCRKAGVKVKLLHYANCLWVPASFLSSVFPYDFIVERSFGFHYSGQYSFAYIACTCHTFLALWLLLPYVEGFRFFCGVLDRVDGVVLMLFRSSLVSFGFSRTTHTRYPTPPYSLDRLIH